jgi:peptidoglycan/xylan/chitin deacetylase (PgdA/CDA1 family)
VSGRFRPLVLCYHAVSDNWPSGLSVGPGELEYQIRTAIRRGYRPVPASDVLAGRGRLLHVTFDDAYRSVATIVPTFERLGVPLTVFACPDYADEGRALAVPELAADVESHPSEVLTMDWAALRALVERGVEVGSHTVTHPHLTQLADEQLHRELRESRDRLEAQLGRPCRFLSYPYGEEDKRVHAAARAAGYEAAFALPGKDRPVNVYALPRVGVYRRDGGLRFRLKTGPLTRRIGSLHVGHARLA